MKHLKLFPKLLIAGLFLLAATGCLKNNDQPAPPVSGVTFVHASPDGPGVSFLVGQNQVTDQLFSYTGHAGYFNVYSGSRQISAYTKDKTVSGTINLEQGKFYSVYLSGSWQTAAFVLLEDSLSQPNPGKAAVRFLNMSVGAPVLDLGQADGTTLIGGKAYQQNSGFIAVDGDKSYNFVIREHGSAQVKVTLPAMSLDAGHIYTIWAKGIYTSTGTDGPGGEFIENY
jgi:hypothetical protein